MAPTKERQKVQAKADELELAISRILKASPSQKAKHRRAFTFLRLQLQREEAELVSCTSFNHSRAIGNGSTTQLAPSSGRMGRQPKDLVADDKSEQPRSGGRESIIDLYLRLARQETELATFFRDRGHLFCLESVSPNEDSRLQHFLECDARHLPERHTRFRRILAILSLAADYEAWEIAQLYADRQLTEIAITTFVREHAELFPDQDLAKRAIYAGKRHRDQDREFPGISAVMAFAPREFDRAGRLDWLNKQFELEELKFIPELGIRFLPYLNEAQHAYEQKLNLDVTERQANIAMASLHATAEDQATNEVPIDIGSAMAQSAAQRLVPQSSGHGYPAEGQLPDATQGLNLMAGVQFEYAGTMSVSDWKSVPLATSSEGVEFWNEPQAPILGITQLPAPLALPFPRTWRAP
ncbi:MAG: hypothetical protein Q9165_008506 [Trypethelium subeluteriae]